MGERGSERAAGLGCLRLVGCKGGCGPIFKRKDFSFYFPIKQHQNSILSDFKAFSRGDPKIKVAQNFMLYNFAKTSKVKFQIDFEL
jgi:hypothetical protein